MMNKVYQGSALMAFTVSWGRQMKHKLLNNKYKLWWMLREDYLGALLPDGGEDQSGEEKKSSLGKSVNSKD